MGTDVTFPMRGEDYTPQQISSMVLKKLIKGAEKIHGDVNSAVITVPANFSEASRKATMQAGEIAGIKIIQPSSTNPQPQQQVSAHPNALSGSIMIYDLGGGTFDVTIAKVLGKKVECITSQGDSRLGGTDVEICMKSSVKFLSGRTASTCPKNPTGPANTMNSSTKQELKITLSKRDVAQTSIIHGKPVPVAKSAESGV